MANALYAEFQSHGSVYGFAVVLVVLCGIIGADVGAVLVVVRPGDAAALKEQPRPCLRLVPRTDIPRHGKDHVAYP